MSDATLQKLAQELNKADAVLVGAGTGLSEAAGFTRTAPYFTRHFSDFIDKYGFEDLCTAARFNYPSQEEKWAFWSRAIYLYRYSPAPRPVYNTLFEIIKDKDYFVITTTADHMFQKSGFDSDRLFYTYGDYGTWQCSQPCNDATYDNEDAVRKMMEAQRDMKVPRSLIPICPACGRKMKVNLLTDDSFVENDGWYRAEERYEHYVRSHKSGRIVFLDIGTTASTPIIIKCPFTQMTYENPLATYATIADCALPEAEEIKDRALYVNNDIEQSLNQLLRYRKDCESKSRL